MGMKYYLAVLLCVVVVPPAFAANQCVPGTQITLEGSATWKKKETKRRAELSGVVMRGGNLLAVSNERTRKRKYVVQVFEPNGTNQFRFLSDDLLIKQPKGVCDGKENDFEAVAIYNDELYAIGSHSLKREMLKSGVLPGPDGRGPIIDCPARHAILKFPVSTTGRIATKKIAGGSLRTFLKGVKAFRPYAKLPSKENGIDIEGLAVTPAGVLIGFRGPILDTGHASILRLDHSLSVKKKSTWFVHADFGGRGVRSMASSGDRIYFLVGPNGTQSETFQIHRWVGDAWPEQADPAPTLKTELVCELDTKYSGKAVGNPEGITVLDHARRTDGSIASTRFVVVFDHTVFRAETWTVKE